MEIQDKIPEMIQAFQIELDGVKKSRRGRSITIYDGIKKAKSGDKFIYVFRLVEEKKILEESFIKITVKGEESEGSILSIEDQILTIAIDKDFGSKIAEAELEEDVTGLYIRIIERLEYVNSHQNQIDFRLSNLLFYPDPNILNGKNNDDFINTDLNTSQNSAANCAMNKEISFIWGPPGTGKTKTLGVIAKELLKENKKILICSHANRATDHAFFNVIKELKKDNFDYKNIATRYTTSLLNEVENINLKELSFDEQLNNLIKKIENRKVEIKQILKDYNDLEALYQELLNAKENSEKLAQKIAEKQNQEEILNKKLILVDNSIDEYIKSGIMKKVLLSFLKSNMNSLEARKKEVREQLHKIRYDSNILIQKLERFKKVLSKEKLIIQEFSNQKEIVEKYGGKDVLTNILEKEDVKIDFNTFFESKKIIATTLAKVTTDAIFKKAKFDVLIVDEASMVPMPLLFVVSSLITERIIITGDPYQLPPISITDDEICKEWLKKDIFQKASGVSDRLGMFQWENNNKFVNFLNTQYRMPDQLCNLVSHYFYEHRIIQGCKNKNEKCIKINDTSDLNPICTKNKWSGTRDNEIHAQVVVDFVISIRSMFIDDKIGIISPYRGQVSKIRKKLFDKKIFKIEVGTIHTFQGREKELIVFDTTDSYNLPAGRLLDEFGPNGEDAKKVLTVAFSRAKSKLVIVANLKYIRQAFNNRILNKALESVLMK